MNKTVAATAAVVAVVIGTVAALSGKEDKPEPEPKYVVECAAGAGAECDALETVKGKPSRRRVSVGSEDCVKYQIHDDGTTEAVSKWRRMRPKEVLTLDAKSCSR